MAREVDEKKTRRILARLQRAKAAAEAAIARSEDAEAAAEAREALTAWEQEFLETVEARLETYGSAFADPEKGALDEPLSRLQIMKLKEIEKKARGKSPRRPRTGDQLHHGSAQTRRAALRRRAPGRGPNVRDVNADLPDGPDPADDPMTRPDPDAAPPPRPEGGFRPVVIQGGKARDDET